jgi:hypothetical protein
MMEGKEENGKGKKEKKIQMERKFAIGKCALFSKCCVYIPHVFLFVN